jgi:hypothetical protein
MVIFTPQPLYLREKDPRCPLDKRLGAPENRSGCGGEVKFEHCPCRELNPGRPSHSLVSILTELSLLTFIKFDNFVNTYLLQGEGYYFKS